VGFWRREYLWPTVLVVVGVYFLLYNLGWLGPLSPQVAWPIILIAIGVWLILRRSRS
jgi:multisubunit Na+/H+ antiporter MnhC subunit